MGRVYGAGLLLLQSSNVYSLDFVHMAEHAALIAHKKDLEQFAPPDHVGTVNVRLSDKSFCEAFEMVLGTVAPGGEAEPHHHEHEHQIIYILHGQADVGLGDDPMITCGAGDVIRIPPKLKHAVVAKGVEDFQCVIIYSPPLPKRDDAPV